MKGEEQKKWKTGGSAEKEGEKGVGKGRRGDKRERQTCSLRPPNLIRAV